MLREVAEGHPRSIETSIIAIQQHPLCKSCDVHISQHVCFRCFMTHDVLHGAAMTRPEVNIIDCEGELRRDREGAGGLLDFSSRRGGGEGLPRKDGGEAALTTNQ